MSTRQTTVKLSIDTGFYPATEWGSGAENGALTNKIGNSQHSNVNRWNPIDNVWYGAYGYQVYDNTPENMSLGAGDNGTSWRAWAR